MTPASTINTPRSAFSYFASPKKVNPPEKVVGASSVVLDFPAEPLLKQSRWDMDPNSLSFAALATRKPSRSPYNLPKNHPVEMGDAQTVLRPTQVILGSRTKTLRGKIEPMLHGDNNARCTQTKWREVRYDTQINGLKSRVYVSETIVGGIKSRFTGVEKLLLDQEKEIGSLMSVTKAQGDMIKQQSNTLKEHDLMIQKLHKLCIKNNGKTADDAITPDKEERDRNKALINDQDRKALAALLPKRKLSRSGLKKSFLQNLCGKHGIAFCDKETKADLISKLTAIL